jgi:hypothetical protein
VTELITGWRPGEIDAWGTLLDASMQDPYPRAWQSGALFVRHWSTAFTTLGNNPGAG